MLATLGGSCTVPVGAFAVAAGAGRRAAAERCRGWWRAATGARVIRMARQGDDPEAVGAELARALLEGGGAAIEDFGASRPGRPPAAP